MSSKTRTASILLSLTALAASVLTAAGGADAASVIPQVKIFLENNNHDPGSVTTSCGPDGPLLHTKLFNDAVGANVVETAVVYAEPANPASGLGTLVFGPVDVPINGSVDVVVPYQAGVTFDAIAVAKGDPLPTSVSDLIARLSAKPPTADNSQLFPSGYPAAPLDCPTPKPTPSPCPSTSTTIRIQAVTVPTCPCPTEPPDIRAVVGTVPRCPCPTEDPDINAAVANPKTCPSESESHRSSSPSRESSSSSSSASSSSSSSSSSPTGTPTGTVSASSPPTTAPASGGLAHTGANPLPFAVVALLLIAAGTGFAGYSIRKRGTH